MAPLLFGFPLWLYARLEVFCLQGFLYIIAYIFLLKMAFKCFLLDGLVGDLGFDKFISFYKVRSAVILPLSLLLNMKFLINRRLSTPPCPCIFVFLFFPFFMWTVLLVSGWISSCDSSTLSWWPSNFSQQLKFSHGTTLQAS